MTAIEKHQAYQQATEEIKAILKGESNMILKMSTINCLLKKHLPYYFWVGFYCVNDGALIVGPYQGTLGCLHISFERGVCGRAARLKTTQIVGDVHADPEHIACDAQSASEIVVPVLDKTGTLIAVFDVDSVVKDSFDSIDQTYLETIISNQFAKSELSRVYV